MLHYFFINQILDWENNVIHVCRLKKKPNIEEGIKTQQFMEAIITLTFQTWL